MRVVICLGLEPSDRWKLAPARLHQPQWISGGVRTLHELAVAAAAAGYETEVRGDVSGPVLAELASEVGVVVGTPTEARPATSDDVLCVPDGIPDPSFFLRVAVMPSTPVYLAFAPPGLFGWSFVDGWQYRDALEVDPDSVGRPEQCRAVDTLGYRIWSNAMTTAAAFEDVGVPVTVIHEGWPGGVPIAPAKDVDVVTVGDNRWRTVTRRAMSGFAGTWRELPAMPHRRLVEELGRGQLFVHCARIEGHSRLGVEARLMAACCVGLSSNRFAVGFDEAAGGAVVDDPAEVPAVLERMLADPEQLRARQSRARRHALSQTGWAAYVERVGAAITAATTGDRHAVWHEVRASFDQRLTELAAELERTRARRSVRLADSLGRRVRRRRFTR